MSRFEEILNNYDGKCVIFSAPSGAGKTTIVHHLLNQDMGLEFSISACTRERRGKEINGVDYYFLTIPEFKNRIDSNEFLEWEEVYTDHFYGTLVNEIERIWKKGHHVIFDVDVVGGLNLKRLFGDRALAVFVMPPSVEALETRLRMRETETEERIALRMKKAREELASAQQFDVILFNDDLNHALEEAYTVVESFLTSKKIAH